MKIVDADLIEMASVGRFHIIVHGCNCFHTMGSGLALAIKNKWPSVYEADCATPKGSRAKLGTISSAQVMVPTLFGSHIMLRVVNAYTQFGYGHPRDGVNHFDPEALRSALTLVDRKAVPGQRIGLPYIGAGRGGGNEAEIEHIIRQTLAQHEVTLVRYSGKHAYKE